MKSKKQSKNRKPAYDVSIRPITEGMVSQVEHLVDRLIGSAETGNKKADQSSSALGTGLSADNDTGSKEGGREAIDQLIANAQGVNIEPVDVPGENQERKWPDSLGKAAMLGLVGDIVHTVEPHSEADPSALLIQMLGAFGNAIGRTAHFIAEADRHYLNLFVTMVGATAKGRKGSSWGQVRRPFESVDSEWAAQCIQGGLSSGEGLINAVRDDSVTDKRLLIFESELASTLRVLAREGNTLSAMIRQAWDCGDLRVLTKNAPMKATGAHISIVAHITRDELRRYLDSTEVGNGFANRFLWVCVRRSKLLPEGGQLHTVDFAPLIRRLKEAIEFARSVGQMRRDEAARRLWAEVYADLSEGKPGLFGAVTSRAEAQVMRLACLYALLDLCREIRLPHLQAALEVWRYCEDSARWIFGQSLGDPIADEILRALKVAGEDGLARSDLHALFGKHKAAAQIGRALADLTERGLARAEKIETGGRPGERWRPITIAKA